MTGGVHLPHLVDDPSFPRLGLDHTWRTCM